MRIYFFTVMIDVKAWPLPDFRGFFIKAKSLSSALKFLYSKIITCYCGLTDCVNWRVCRTYSILSATGRFTYRALNKDVRGIA